MAGFQRGWYAVFNYKNGDKLCLFFKNSETFTAKCKLAANGQQFLLWHDPQGPDGVGQPGRWLPEYEVLGRAPLGDWWDNEQSRGNYKPENPGAFSRTARTPTARELSGRATASNAADASGLCCTKEIHVGVFFDGTNNNMLRDRPVLGHSNIVTLFGAHKADGSEHFRYYIPGVGTEFAEIGEYGEDADGKTFGAGGEARIHYGMLQVYNAVCRAATGTDLFGAVEMKDLVTGVFTGLSTLWRWGDSKTVLKFREFDRRLLRAVEGKRPKVTKVNVAVFGFSRGAAEARAFAQWIQKASEGTIGGAVFEFRFMGIFDTVASVLLADSSPVGGSGFMDWANKTMEISGVTRTVHFVAAHEFRRSFPLSTARAGKTWPSGTKEFVYPGAHSDVGGGYSPGDQGKATPGRSALLSQIPLNDLYFEALNSAVKLYAKNELPPVIRADFAIHPGLDAAFKNYAEWTARYDEKQDIVAAGGAPEDRMAYHTQLYWRWRASVSSDGRFTALSSYRNANPQDRTDLWEGELDWRRDVERARQAASETEPVYVAVPGVPVPVPTGVRVPKATALQRDILENVERASTVPAHVSEFYDNYVHDSHAGFWLLGPITKLDKKLFIAEVKARKAEYDRLMRLAAETGNPGRSRNFRNQASAYELNNFERRVLAADLTSPGSMPVMTDADAESMRNRAGFATSTTLKWMGTATRREAGGHGRYRRIFDQS